MATPQHSTHDSHHGHHPHQCHHTSHGHGAATLADAYQEYWNSAADTIFEAQWVKGMHAQIEKHFEANLGWIGINPDDKSVEGKRMLDYACGEGFLSRLLSPYFEKCMGVDIAEAMASRYNKIAREKGFSENQMIAVQGDLTSDNTPEPFNSEEYFNFDLIVISMALHHLKDAQNAVNKLVERLKPGTGVLVVIDWEIKKDAHGKDNSDWVKKEHAAQHTVAHAGFEEGQFKEMMIKAGCNEASYLSFAERTAIPMAKDGYMQLFSGKGKKKAE